MELYIGQLETEVKKLVNSTSELKTNYKKLLSDHVELQLVQEQYENRDKQCVSTVVLNSTCLDSLQNGTKHLEMLYQTTQSKVNMLISNQDAQKQDFLALYNLTLNTKTELSTFKNEISNKLHLTEVVSNKTWTTQNSQIEHLSNKIDAQVQNLRSSFASGQRDLKAQLDKESEAVFVTACVDGNDGLNGGNIKFTKIKTQHGISSYTLTSQGQFTCQNSGLYLIVASLMSSTQNGEYQIVKDGSPLVHVRIAPSDSDYHTGTGSALTQLQYGQKVAIHANPGTFVRPGYSCVSIVKLK
ncbi:unnamed protein product [Mytilus edulis]|uniref:C1q domain-containing protein n=1 Tax=Mytilus edulis TaxID=6550 RepID=A0A8S3UT63_MYTED|nr:unnamed protein product [Mytilus edulis]